MAYACKILADSISPHGIRLTTLQATFPRFVLSELNTHRMLSRNSASSRAIPPEKLIEAVTANPFIPEFNRRVKGMGVGDPLDAVKAKEAKNVWLEARKSAVKSAEWLVRLDVDKSRVNRLLEPFMWHTAIITATEWENFFNLRCHKDAQPEIREIAKMIYRAREASTPDTLAFGEWHLPLVNSDNPVWSQAVLASASAGRCARVSYLTQENEEPLLASANRWDRLRKSGHWSPAEHPARCADSREFEASNFKGWTQLRKLDDNEAIFPETYSEDRPPGTGLIPNLSPA